MPSLRHRMLALVIGRVLGAREVDDAEKVRREVLGARGDDDATPHPRSVRGCTLTRDDTSGFPVFTLVPEGTEPVRTVLYLHGGGYAGEVGKYHWRFVSRLARGLGARVVLPAYPLAPEHTWRDTHPAMLRLVEQLAVESPHGVVLMGDSAGGGLALAVAQQVARRPGPQPTDLVLLSPWADLTGTTPGTAEASARDPWLRRTKIDLYARWWAGSEDDLARPEVSPLLGDHSGLPRTLVMCGTRDTLWPQSVALVRDLAAAGVAVTYHEEPDLLHVYPVLPVPEAATAMEQVLAWLR